MSSANSWSWPKEPLRAKSSPPPRATYNRYDYPKLWEKAREDARASVDRDHRSPSQSKAWQALTQARTQQLYDIYVSKEKRNDEYYASGKGNVGY